jgi:hypothetical protein
MFIVSFHVVLCIMQHVHCCAIFFFVVPEHLLFCVSSESQ